MMGRRLQLQDLLESLLGSTNVYFQPPTNITLKYPCIIYSKDNEAPIFANNRPYDVENRYAITVIDRDPDSDIPGKVSKLPMSRFNRHFVADNLYHDIYNLYY